MINVLQKVNFRPLEYIEVLQGKPINIEIEKGLILCFNLSVVKDFIYFNENYKLLFKQIEYLNNNPALPNVGKIKIAYFIKLIELLFNLIKKDYGYFKGRNILKRLKFVLLNDIEKLINVYDTLLKYNSELKKKLFNLQQ